MKKFFAKRNIFLSLGAVLTLGLIGFVENKNSEKEVKRIIVDLEDKSGSYFIDESDVRRLLNNNNTDSIRGKLFSEINLKELEGRLYKNKFVQKAEVYKDHKGNIKVDVSQWRALARIVQQKGPQAYIGEAGNILPLSEKFTARVLIVDGEKAGMFLDSAYQKSAEAKAFVKMLHLIDKDPFLKAQISQITFKANGKMLIFSQVGDETVEFGKVEDLEEKFKKYKIYYKNILPLKGYNKYKRVNLEYTDQIICE